VRVGFNYPWSHNRDGSQIGPDIWVNPDVWAANNALEAAGQVDKIKPPPMFDYVDRNLANLKKMGVDIVRWFLLGKGTNYGPAPTAAIGSTPSPVAGGGYTYGEWAFSPPTKLDKRFTRDFELLLKRFAKAEMQILPSLIDYQFGSDAPLDPSCPSPNGTVSSGRADVIRDPDKRKIFLDTVLGNLLAVSSQHREQIFAWEVINEPFWLCRGYGALTSSGWLARRPEVTDEQMHDFLDDATKRIEAAHFSSTVGHRYFDDLDRWPTGSMPQFHYYAERSSLDSRASGYSNDPGQIRGSGLFSREPKPIVGEFDSSANRFGDPWAKDLGPRDTTLTRLQLLQEQQCDTAVIWYDYSDAKPCRVAQETLDQELTAVKTSDVIKLLGDTRRYIASFTGGTPPPAGE
jgi:hypothetical protein